MYNTEAMGPIKSRWIVEKSLRKKKLNYVAPVVQLVTSNLLTLGLEFESLYNHTNSDFSSQGKSGERLIRGHTKFDFTVDDGKGRLNLSRDRKLRQAPQ